MKIIWIFVLGGAVLLWMGFPLWRGRSEAKAEPIPAALHDLLFQKDVLLATARDLDLDLETDKLSPEDHRFLRERCQAEAVAVMERLETIAPAQSQPVPGAAAEAGQKVALPPDGKARFCPRCGQKTRPPYRFCPACGLPHSGHRGDARSAEKGRRKKV